MEIIEKKGIDDLVFPQDVPLQDAVKPDGTAVQVRYGGLTKHELFTAMFVAAQIQRAGLPPTPGSAESMTKSCTYLAWALLGDLANFVPPKPEDFPTPSPIHGVS